MPFVYVDKPAPLVDYRQQFSWRSLTNPEKIAAILEGEKKIAFDTETNGLNPLTSRIAGYSFSVDGKTGYYVPLLHKRDVNAPREALDLIVDYIRNNVTFMFNKKFDLNMLEIAEGYDLGHCMKVYDTQALVWLKDCDVKMPSLKWASEFYLGIRQPTYEETIEGSVTFDYARVEDVVEYAALDAICTYQLTGKMMQLMPKIKQIFKIDNLSIEAVRKFEHNDIPLDVEWLKKEEQKCVGRIQKCRKEIFDAVGYDFNPDSTKQKADALLACGARLKEKTDKGNWKVDIKNLEDLDHPLAKILVKYSQEQKYHGSFVSKLLSESERQVRFNYITCKVPTGRFASGSEKKNSFYTKLNIQAVTKAEEIDVAVVKDQVSPTGWRIKPLEEVSEKAYGHYITESCSYEHGIRSAFIPYEDSIYVSIDYKTEELRIAANLSQEPIWIEAFLKGRDIHMETAKAVFGENADNNDRKKAKIVNFAALYGANEYTLHYRMNCSIPEAKLFLDKYNNALKSLTRWKAYIQRKARKEDMYTFLGRPRRMARYFRQDAERSYRAFGYRTSVNTVVQGAGGDIIRYALGRIHIWRLKNPKEAENFKILSTIHDEINFSVKNNWLHEFMANIPMLMEMRWKEWPIPIEVDVSIGTSWGRTVGYSYDKENKIFTPKGKLIT